MFELIVVTVSCRVNLFVQSGCFTYINDPNFCFAFLTLAIHSFHIFVNCSRYQEYGAAQQEKVETMKLIDEKLGELEQSNKAHNVCSS